MTVLDGVFAPAPKPDRVQWLTRWDYAHRGLHGANAGGHVPENSPAAFADAMARGIGIELDVQRSRDGHAMVFHDWELDRLTAETGPVSARDAVQLETIRLTANGDPIPTLRHTLDQIAGRVPVLIEVKSAYDKGVVPLCKGVRRALEGYSGNHAVMSFDPAIPRWFARNSPRTLRGLVITETNQDNWGGKWGGTLKRRLALWGARPDFLAYNVDNLPSVFAAAQRARGLPVLTWTVRNAAQQKVAMRGADAVIAEFEER